MSRTIVADLGWCVGRLVVDDKGAAESLHIISPAHTNNDRYAPCESIEFMGRGNIMKLKTFLDQNILADKAQP